MPLWVVGRRSVRSAGSGILTPSPRRNGLVLRTILSQALAPLQSFTNAPPWLPVLPARTTKPRSHPFRGLFPFSVLPAMRSHIAPVSFHLTGWVAPLGFRTPATLCSPHDLPGLFHPGPAHGVSLRGFAPPETPFAFAGAVTLPRFTRLTSRAAPGLCSFRGSRAVALGLASTTAGCPLGVLPLRGFLPPTFG
jgi:hypothetical protein